MCIAHRQTNSSKPQRGDMWVVNLAISDSCYLNTQMSTDLSRLEEIYGSPRLRFN